jgi:hypothetical protein
MTVPKRPAAPARAVPPVLLAVQRKTDVAVPAPYSPAKRAIVAVPKPFIPVQTKASVLPASLSRNIPFIQAKAVVQSGRPLPPPVPVFVPIHQGSVSRTPVRGLKPGSNSIVQRSSDAASSSSKSTEKKCVIPAGCYPRPMAGKDVEALACFHKDGVDAEKLDEAKLKKIGLNLYSLTPLVDSVNCNCYSWALGNNYFEDVGGPLSTWKERCKDYTFSEPPANNAKIILWGLDADNVTHASVLLTHEELMARAKSFGLPYEMAYLKKQLTEIGNPCWTSASGSGFGIFIHPKDWFQGGEFGIALAGMAKR